MADGFSVNKLSGSNATNQANQANQNNATEDEKKYLKAHPGATLAEAKTAMKEKDNEENKLKPPKGSIFTEAKANSSTSSTSS